MIFVSLGFTAYIAGVRPYEDQLSNKLELFNEYVILACLYHMLLFTEALTDDEQTLFNIGWSLVLLFGFQFFLNTSIVAYNLIKAVC